MNQLLLLLIENSLLYNKDMEAKLQIKGTSSFKRFILKFCILSLVLFSPCYGGLSFNRSAEWEINNSRASLGRQHNFNETT
jgi:hypothetical protein